jgi:hypothetical protein
MKTYQEFLNEQYDIDPEIIKEIKRNFLKQIISAGYVKPTANPEAFERFIEDVIERG